jgi:hypothetical protein
LLENEHEILMKIMTRKGKDEVIDCATAANGGVCQTTFGALYHDKDGKPKPVETVLSHTEDYCTCQCLDYILLINRNKQSKYDKSSFLRGLASPSNYSPNHLQTDEQIPTERKGDNLKHSAIGGGGGPGEKKIIESPV